MNTFRFKVNHKGFESIPHGKPDESFVNVQKENPRGEPYRFVLGGNMVRNLRGEEALFSEFNISTYFSFSHKYKDS
jgi:Mor family transcriptional regulator